MTEYTYKIAGNITCDGFETVEIEEYITIAEMSAEKALETFLTENEQFDFFGSLKTCDVETGGRKGATFRDQNEDQTIDVDLV